MKYLSLIAAAIIFMACSITNNTAPTIPPNIPTPTPVPPAAINEILSVNPIVRTAEDGQVVLEPNTSVTVRWDGLPAGSNATFVVSNFLVDGGVMEIGQGTEASFIVPERIEGEISASVQLADSTTVNAISIPIVTDNMIAGDCQYLPPALGPGVTMYAIADMSGDTVGNVIYDAAYIVVGSTIGLDAKGAEQLFYEIQHVNTGIFGWVPANVGENLAGECSAFE